MGSAKVKHSKNNKKVSIIEDSSRIFGKILKNLLNLVIEFDKTKKVSAKKIVVATPISKSKTGVKCLLKKKSVYIWFIYIYFAIIEHYILFIFTVVQIFIIINSKIIIKFKFNYKFLKMIRLRKGYINLIKYSYIKKEIKYL